MAEKKDDAAEEGCAGRTWSELEGRLPACATERGSFMAPFEWTYVAEHPYAKTSKTHEHFAPTPFRHPPYSAACIPFRWMLRGEVEGNDQQEGLAAQLMLDYRQEREPELSFENNWIQERQNQLILLDTFFSAVRLKESLCFFYAKRTPLADDPRRVIVGVGRVLSVADSVEYRYTVHTKDAPLRAMMWERSVGHSIRAGFDDGFLLPYQSILELAQKDDTINPADYVAFAPSEHFDEFSYVTAHVSHGAAISGLLACAAALQKIGNLVPGPWDKALAWIDRELNRLWKMRGPFPGFGSALTALGIPHGNLIAYDIAAAQAQAGNEWNEDPWPLFEKVLEDPGVLSPAVAKEIGATFKKTWAKLTAERKALIKLLSRFEISAEQATRYYQPPLREKAKIHATDAELIKNAYLLYELDRTQPDPIPLEAIDRGMFPDPVVRDRHPIPPPSVLDDAADARRVRAFVLDDLELAADAGHTLKPHDWVVRDVWGREVRPKCPLTIDVLPVVEETFGPMVQRVAMADGKEAFQLVRYTETKAIIAGTIEKRIKGKRHAATHDWRKLVDAVIEDETRRQYVLGASRDDKDEDAARTEKAAALEEVFASRLSVLIGPAGTGKTTLLKALVKLSEVKKGGILLLAPTGKARVRLQEQTELSDGQTVAQFLLRLGRYDGSTGRYFHTGEEPRASGYMTVIIDECSMLTEEQLAAVLDALEGVQRLILVGDPRQLPPIGAGRPFLDVVRRLAPRDVETIFPKRGPGYGELTIVRRQTGAVRDDMLLAGWFSGRPTDPGADEVWDRSAEANNENVRMVRWSTPEELEKALIEQLKIELPLDDVDDEKGFETSIGGEPYGSAVYFWPKMAAQGSYPAKDGAAAKVEAWQILSPVRAQLHGVDSLNRTIQARFRRRVREWAEPDVYYYRKVPKPFGPQRILYGDKIISVRNGRRYKVYPKPEELPYIANGDMGVVVGQYKTKSLKGLPWKLEVEFRSQRGYKIDYFESEFGDEGDGAPLELAYALTVHKTQGSEFGTTFVILPNPCRPLSRELLYTALTRHKDRIVILHQGDVRDFRKYSAGYFSETAARLTNLFEAPRPVEVRSKDDKNPRFLEDGLIHRTRRGDLVRSKSEVIIADALFTERVKYHYELDLVGSDGKRRSPDFTIPDEASDVTYYWEHLGMLYDPAYRARWEAKLAWYRKEGILPHTDGGGPKGTLIITQDDERGGIDSSWVAKLIREILHGR
ncbi:hypothetical protein BE21_20050 [Sorangium cellulosum]|uniref:AAA+ ATPase domain-containing protein n=1 Tax=Sorangium cellulosum TaxID=56 RepID=A0A150TWJ7_SORCE|nr:hypothetical protein BE21_20050 [Sorangium cellulosum]